MGLLTIADGSADVNKALDIANTVAVLWNDYGGQDNGFAVSVGKAEVRQCCGVGGAILSKFFGDHCNPGPFKRVACFVVISRLFPFFSLSKPPITGTTIQWHSRLSALLIPATLRVLHVNVSTAKDPDSAPIWKTLSNWKYFPSAHLKLDFLAWLAWMDLLDRVQPYLHPPENVDPEKYWVEIRENRLARMILVTALMLESFYYCGEGLPAEPGPDHIRGKCLTFLLQSEDLSALIYDRQLIDKYEAIQKANLTKQ